MGTLHRLPLRNRFLSTCASRVAAGGLCQPILPSRCSSILAPSSIQGRAKSKKSRVIQIPAVDRRCGLLIDGDVFGPGSWPAALAALKDKRMRVQAHVFGPPGRDENKTWKSEMLAHSISFVPVFRRTGGAKDPNDIAIGMEASRMVFQERVDAVALLVADADFVYLVGQLHHWGCCVFAILREGLGAGTFTAFREAGAEVLVLPEVVGKGGRGKHKVVLHESGESTFPEWPESEHLDSVPEQDMQDSVDRLVELEYMWSKDDPILPAIAKFFHANSIGPVTLWPGVSALIQFRAALASHPHRAWRRNPGDQIFVLPKAQSLSSKSDLEQHGSRECSRVVRGGGAFIIQDSACVVDLFLHRLGYLCADLECDVGDAVDVFSKMNMNHAHLTQIGISIPSYVQTFTKKSMLHAALASPRATGHWQIAPKDTAVRSLLKALGKIPSTDVSSSTFNKALVSYSRLKGLPLRKSLAGRVQEVLYDLNPCDPLRRSLR